MSIQRWVANDVLISLGLSFLLLTASMGLLSDLTFQEIFAASAGQISDYNRDGYADLAIGVPLEDVGTGAATIANAGSLNVIYGSKTTGLSPTAARADQTFSQDSPNIEGAAEWGDYFGYSSTSGDFNGDWYTDLAIGVPREDIGTVVDGGAVNVIYGSSSGLSATTQRTDQTWSKQSVNIEGDIESCQFFGFSLANGDFNGDEIDDLAVGAPSNLVDCGGDDNSLFFSDGVSGMSTVSIIYGSPSGLSATQIPDLLLTPQDFPIEGRSAGIGAAESGLGFGGSLAVGDFNNDAYDDLAIGFPGAFDPDDESNEEAGAVEIIYGTSNGLSLNSVQHLTEDDIGFDSTINVDFGAVLASGDFDADSNDDLAIGAFKEDAGFGTASATYGGNVYVIYGSPSGLDPLSANDPPQIWNQNRPQVEGDVEEFDYFGYSLAVGRFDSDGYSDLAIGVPYEDLGSFENAGGVNVLYGSSGGLRAIIATDGTGRADQFWEQNSANVTDSAEMGDRMGLWVRSDDFNGDGKYDLAISAPNEDLGTVTDAGIVHIIYGSNGGLSATATIADQMWHQNSGNVEGSSEAEDAFGGAATLTR